LSKNEVAAFLFSKKGGNFNLMNFFDFEGSVGVPSQGKFLIAGPFLSDPDFSRGVVLLCEHTEEGTLGFVLNHPLSLTLADVAESLDLDALPIALYQGGPVEKDTLHILHRLPDVLGGKLVADNIYWGGSFETLIALIKNNALQEEDVRLFIGYSGWSHGQLDKEMEEGAWLIGNALGDIVFETEPHLVWKAAIKSLGNNYAYLANTPVNPQLN
jgi:putative transcriptional regulator